MSVRMHLSRIELSFPQTDVLMHLTQNRTPLQRQTLTTLMGPTGKRSFIRANKIKHLGQRRSPLQGSPFALRAMRNPAGGRCSSWWCCRGGTERRSNRPVGELHHSWQASNSFWGILRRSPLLPRRPRRWLFRVKGWNLQSAPIYNVHITVYASYRQEASGLEEGGSERAGGEMVREGCQESCEEVEKDRTVGGVGESHHNTEHQHEMLNNNQVTMSAGCLARVVVDSQG